jgi:hypothetical protein
MSTSQAPRRRRSIAGTSFVGGSSAPTQKSTARKIAFARYPQATMPVSSKPPVAGNVVIVSAKSSNKTRKKVRWPFVRTRAAENCGWRLRSPYVASSKAWRRRDSANGSQLSSDSKMDLQPAPNLDAGEEQARKSLSPPAHHCFGRAGEHSLRWKLILPPPNNPVSMQIRSHARLPRRPEIAVQTTRLILYTTHRRQDSAGYQKR